MWKLSESEFRNSIPFNFIELMQLIHGIVISVTIMGAFAIVLIYLDNRRPQPADIEMIKLLTKIHAGYAVAMIFGSSWYLRRHYSSKHVDEVVEASYSLYDASLVIIRKSMHMRIIMLESAAIFGLIVTLMVVNSGLARSEPLYLLNTLSFILLVVAGLIFFPREELLVRTFRRRILKAEL